jgi:uncharacterized membrane protein YvbJ
MTEMDQNSFMLFCKNSGMASKGDEHIHHPVCEVCGKEFSDTHQLSMHIDEIHRNNNN